MLPDSWEFDETICDGNDGDLVKLEGNDYSNESIIAVIISTQLSVLVNRST